MIKPTKQNNVTLTPHKDIIFPFSLEQTEHSFSIDKGDHQHQHRSSRQLNKSLAAQTETSAGPDNNES
jgi:hypothetical protein